MEKHPLAYGICIAYVDTIRPVQQRGQQRMGLSLQSIRSQVQGMIHDIVSYNVMTLYTDQHNVRVELS